MMTQSNAKVLGDLYELHRINNGKNQLKVIKGFSTQRLAQEWKYLIPSYVGATTVIGFKIFQLSTVSTLMLANHRK